ncbi:DNA polymerase [Crossiella cryophila]|uniref:DNA-directed DNA polymerase n=1 Tax=Crossiella cryophila TaxID=43355 RepID=A0A7W7CIF5_9PSEU|nr:DNA polymerase [Crossiella cryophila]MBB4681794.1 DNA polymerase-1 [Crossiella cryophila]
MQPINSTRPVRHLTWEELLDTVRRGTPMTGPAHLLGLELSGWPGAWHVRVEPFSGTMAVLVAEVDEHGLRQLGWLDRTQRIRWVATDLGTVAIALAKVGVQLRLGYCLTLAQRAVDGYHRAEFTPPSDRAGLSERYRQIQADIGATSHGSALERLIELDSANALAAAELNVAGLPWDTGRHREVLTGLLGESSQADLYPRLTELDEQVAECFGGARFRWRTELPDAFDGEGVEVHGSRICDIEHLEHPAVPLLTRWRHLDALAHQFGYDWAKRWTVADRWFPVFYPAGTSTGRWTAEGGGLQLPRSLRCCVRARPGRRLLIADVSQLEPRILAHMAGDSGLLDFAEHDDPYEGLGRRFGMDRATAKTALLAALYGRRSGASRQAMNLLMRSCRAAMELLAEAEERARHGAAVRTELARTLPRPEQSTWSAIETSAARRTAEERLLVARFGRRGRAFPVQGTAAEVCCAALAALRTLLRGEDAGVVAFLHDEFVVEVAEDAVGEIEPLLRHAVLVGLARVVGQDAGSLPVSVHSGMDWERSKS